MGRIHQLDEHLSNMIAAGEVVERPSGIVKELVENCIDAHAHHVQIQITQGGIDTITIIDDGDGMDAQDATLAFERHATSKIREVDDLWNINTMGFRGEALPSIASVSHVLLRTSNGVDSTEVEISYGSLVHAIPAGTPKGTMIEIRNLFQKTPARFKHLKSPQYEFSLISDVIQKFAISHPNIGFDLTHDGRSIFKTRGNGNLREVLMQIYGRESAKSAIELDGKDQDYQIVGFALQPQFQRATKYYILLYINGRMIRNYHLQKAVQDAYSPYMPKDRYPIAVINMVMDAQLVDVNVHPSKWEIRLSKEKQLEKLLYETIRLALQEHMAVPNVNVRKESGKEKVEMQELQFTYNREDNVTQLHEEVNKSFVQPQEEPALDMKELHAIVEERKQQLDKEERIAPMQSYTKELTSTENSSSEGILGYQEKKLQESSTYSNSCENTILDGDILDPITNAVEEQSSIYDDESHKVQETSQPVIATVQEDDREETTQTLFKDTIASKALSYPKPPLNPSLPQLRVIGQFHRCYIIAEGEKGLYIIDQHAAQERYHYEIIREQIMSGNKDTQPLLLPITIESSIAALSQVDAINALMEQIGIHLEVFGNATFVCRELPVWMKDIEEEAFLRDMIDLWQRDTQVSLDQLRKHAVATMACHSSIRFNRTLNMEEMNQVIEDLGKCVQPFHCPHGRPTLICLEEKNLIHDFERG